MAPYEYISPEDCQEAQKKTTVSSRSWVLVDCTGKTSILDVDKYGIMERLEIHGRDLKIFDPLLSHPSTILVREKAIVLNLEYIKAIITANEVLLQDPLDDNINPIVEELQRRLPLPNPVHKESPFELLVLEVALEAICSFLGKSTTELEIETYPALDKLTAKVSSKHLDKVRKLKSEMTSLTARVQKVRDQLEQLMNDDDHMADLYLSRKLATASSPVDGSGAPDCIPSSPTMGSKTSKPIKANAATFHGDENNVEELEMLLETYFMQFDESLGKLTTLRGFIGDTEDFINIQLENRRNQIIQVELFVGSSLLCLNFYSMVIQIFSSNIPYPWNNGPADIFTWVCIVPGIVSIILLVILINFLRSKGLMGS